MKAPGGEEDELEATRTAQGSNDGGVAADPGGVAAAGGLSQPPRRLPAPLQTRDRERYDVLGEHGRGGLGTVARAHDKELDRDVAIKELLRRGDAGEVRFLREALITARLEHPGIVPIHEAGRWPDGTPFYVMKLVSGRSLKELIEERQTVEERIALLHHVIAVADAMAYAHKRRIIHRDLKPSNVIAGDFGETIVIDWGLAKDLSASGSGEPGVEHAPYRSPVHDELTQAGSVLGTPMYMPPEQWRGDAVDQRADVFAIGAMLWELCSLQRVPPAEARLRDRMLRRAGIDKDLAAIIAKSLAPDPADRYVDAGELAHDLKAFKSGARITARAYSPFAVIAHWTRRHRALAATIAVAAVLATAGTTAYVRNIAIERDRADAERAIANAERDNAQLSEATALLDKDPTRALALLDSIPLHTPRHALLRSRASHGAAAHVLKVPGGITRIRLHPTTFSVVVITRKGDLVIVDPEKGDSHVVDRDLRDSIAWYADHWIYARKPFGAHNTTVVTTTNPPQVTDVGQLLATPTGTLLAAAGRTYALDSGDLYTVEDRGPTLIQHGVRSIAGDEHLLLVCTIANELEIRRDGLTELRTSCAKNPSIWPMSASGGNYAALLDSSTLLLVRGGQTLHLSTHIEGEYELALSSSGLLAMADFSDKAWLVRPGSDLLELGPLHSARPMSVAVSGQLAAWGYTDGAVMAIDTKNNRRWEFKGHSSAVTQIIVDEKHQRIISVGGDEIRVWMLAPSPFALIDHVPCTVFNLAPSLDHTRALFDCDDGGVRLWSFASNKIQEVHRHKDYSYGIGWMRNMMCSAGLDRRVICTNTDGVTRVVMSDAGKIRRLRGSPDHERLAITTDDGTLREFDGTLRTLFAHEAEPAQMAFSPDGRWLASSAADGSIIIWDTSERQVRSKTKAHTDTVTSLGWRDGELWTASADGTVKQWSNGTGSMTLMSTSSDKEAFRFLHLLPDGWVASVNGRELLTHRASQVGALRLDVDRHVERLEVSNDSHYVAVSSTGEIVVIDLVRHAVASLPVSSNATGYIGFTDQNSLIVDMDDGLLNLPLSALRFVRFE